MDENVVMDDQPKEEQKLHEEVEANEPSENLESDSELNENLDEEMDSEDEDEDSQEEKLYTKKQLDRQLERRVRKERRKSAREVEELKNEMAKLREEFSGNRQPQPDNLDDMDVSNMSPQEYARQVMEHTRRLDREKEQQQANADAQAKYYRDLMKKGAEKYGEDYEDVVNDAEYTPVMVEAINLHDNSEDVLYYFANNQEHAEKLAGKTAAEQVREVNRVAVKLATKQMKRKVSEAPEPSALPKGDKRARGNDYMSVLNSNMSLREIAAARAKK